MQATAFKAYFSACILLAVVYFVLPRKLLSVSIPRFSLMPFSTLRVLQYCQINGSG